jgi:hypothetical protein
MSTRSRGGGTEDASWELQLLQMFAKRDAPLGFDWPQVACYKTQELPRFLEVPGAQAYGLPVVLRIP